MKNNDEQNQAIFEDMKTSLQEIHFLVSKECTNEDGFILETKIAYGNIGIAVSISYYPRIKMIDVLAHYGRVPKNKISPLYELLNYLNLELIASHFAVQPDTFATALRSGIHVSGSLDKNAFKETLQQIAAVTIQYYPVLAELMSTKAMPKEIVKAFTEKREAAAKLFK